MYTIIIVDDELEIRESMVDLVDWNRLGFQVVGQAKDGNEALEMIEQRTPDIVLTDINMPYMNGLQLIECLSNQYPTIKVLIISGHEDFEYAKKAIYYNVLDYLLKPINKSEIETIFMKVKEQLDEKRKQLQDVHILKQQFEDTLPILRQRFLSALVEGKMSEELVHKQLEECCLTHIKANNYMCVNIYLNAFEKHNTELSYLSLQQLIDVTLLKQYKGISFQYVDHICVILSDVDIVDNVVKSLSNISEEAFRILQMHTFIGVGNVYEDLLSIAKSYDEAMMAINYQDYQEGNRVIFINDIVKEDNRVQVDVYLERDIINAMKENQEDDYERVVHKLSAPLKNIAVSEEERSLYAIQVFTMMMQIAQKFDLRVEEVIDDSCFSILAKVTNVLGMENWLHHILRKMREALKSGIANKSNDIVSKAKRYVLEHYEDPNLSLENICEILQISPTYLSSLFKQKSNENFVSYVTRIRMERAAELLDTSEDKTYVIAHKVGYNDPNYFNYVFKKHMGMTPIKYRKRSV